MELYDDPWTDTPGTVRKGYDAAQVCLNGHLITTFVHTQPEYNKKFCSDCGAQTMSACKKCNAEIHGHYYEPGVVDLTSPGPPPSFCHNCGNPYPWTEHRLKAAQEVANAADQLSEPEKIQLKESVEELIHNKPGAPGAIIKYKKLAAKAGKQVADGLKSILVEVLSEAIKKQMWP
ncbi:MAG TPA: DUF2321 domain-containing protein [Candidatus Sulfotelmatobacter sp.]|nr:DUF2321 domain-containing protein [Candidatus Sulfotelmatobacter sp.]